MFLTCKFCVFIAFTAFVFSFSALASNECESTLSANVATREKAIELLNIYGKAWETRDPDLITTIFTQDATYLDPKEPENIGIDSIRTYWTTKVIGEQRDIKFHLKNVWVDGQTVIAEWFAIFTDIKRNVRIELSEVAIFILKDGKFGSLREYYKSKKVPL